MIAHDRYESLAGALMLGEASDEERAEFAAHAERCADCAADLAAFAQPSPAARIARSREAETWRPDVSASVLRRIRVRREGRMKIVLGALGGALALSLALDFTLSGYGKNVAAEIDPQPMVGMASANQWKSDPQAFEAEAPPAESNVRRAAAVAAAKRRELKARAERLALAKRQAQMLAEERLDDPVDSRASARKLIPTAGVIVADPLAGTPLAANAKATGNATASSGERHVAVDSHQAILEGLRH